MAFPDNLPPQGLDLFYKYLLYFTIVYIVTTAISSRLITRRRQFSKITQPIKKESIPIQYDYANEDDNTAAMLIRMAGLEASLQELTDLKEKDDISDDVFLELKTSLNSELEKLSSNFVEEESIDDLLDIDKGEDNLLDDLDLKDDDDFLKPKSFTAPKPVVPKSFTAPKPVAPKSFTAPKPVAPKSFTAPKPEVPKSFSAPKPVSTPAPTPTIPKSSKPIPATPKPVQVTPTPVSQQNPTEGKGFAKSTSIAAIRMDMLRELARLKKLIDEDDK